MISKKVKPTVAAWRTSIICKVNLSKFAKQIHQPGVPHEVPIVTWEILSHKKRESEDSLSP
jgi:hypothetical protein